MTFDIATPPLLPAFVGAPERNRVYQVDALTLLRAMPSGSVGLIVASPPYDNLRTYNGYSFDFEPIAHESYRVLKDGGVLVWVVGDATIDGSETLTSFRQALHFKDVVGFRMHDTMIFQKNASSPNTHHPRYLQEFEFMFVLTKGATPRVWHPIMRPNSGGTKAVAKTKTQRNGEKIAYGGNRELRQPCPLGNVWIFNVGAAAGDDSLSWEHPAPFPEALAERHILTWSNPGDLVMDYFAGSGTTLKMARNTGRDYIGCDISYEYVQICKERLRLPYERHYIEHSDDVSHLPLFAANA